MMLVPIVPPVIGGGKQPARAKPLKHSLPIAIGTALEWPVRI